MSIFVFIAICLFMYIYNPEIQGSFLFFSLSFFLVSFFSEKTLASVLHSLYMNLSSPSLWIVAELPTGSPESNRFYQLQYSVYVYVLEKISPLAYSVRWNTRSKVT